ncbi:MAG: hypothetical protein ABID38_05180 [Candidatus Diapherotrites archaeon]
MYPETGGAEAGGGDYPSGGGFKLGQNMEGLIPIVLIVIIAFFVLVRIEIIDDSTPVIGVLVSFLTGGDKAVDMLIIGSTSQEVIDVLDQNDDLVKYRVKTAESLDRNPEDQLKNNKIVLLDQSEQANKEISRQLGEALAKYVNGGGNLIVVKNSGIRRPGASDVIGWEASMKDTVPVRCDLQLDNRPVCDEGSKIFVRARIYRLDEDHPIMEGIEQAPADPYSNLYLDTFDVGYGNNYKEVAYMEDGPTKKTYPAIVERTSLLGKSIYFNYNPGKTRGILENTLEYLK